jgi:GT2 family glycosyltransferase
LHDLGITGSSLLDYNYPHKTQSLGGYIHKLLGSGKNIVNIDEIDKIEYIVGASFLIKKIVFNKIGLLPEEYFLYYEDSDYCFNARDVGFRVGTAVDSIVYHKEGGTTGTSKSIYNKSYMSDFYSFRSHKIFWKKYFKERYWLIYFQLVVYLVHRLLHGKFRNMLSLINAFFSEVKK